MKLWKVARFTKIISTIKNMSLQNVLFCLNNQVDNKKKTSFCVYARLNIKQKVR